MASTIIFSTPAAVALITSARRKAPRKPSPRIVKRSTPPLVSPLLRSGGGGGDATTYTRLPPKDSFVDPSLEVSLHDFFQALRPKDRCPIAEESQEEPQRVEHDEGCEDAEEIFSDGDGGDATASDLEELVGEDDVDDDAKEKGVPAVMRCFDRTKIYVRSGDGGSGAVAFRREIFVPHGGPSGGDGGKGGDVYLEVDGSMNSLLSFRKAMHFRAGAGSHGQGKKQVGAKGEDVVVKVAPGTLISEATKYGVGGGFSMELLHPGQRVLLLPGGRGGKGNASFKSGTNKVPRISEKGEKGTEM